MHMLTDENGNIIPHGGDHEHSHEHSHTHSHEHTHADGHTHSHEHEHHHTHDHDHDGGHTHDHAHNEEHAHEHSHDHEHIHEHSHDHHHHDHGAHAETDALIGYMVSHNAHHAEELKEIAHTLRHEGRGEIADCIEAAVTDFAAGNEKLSKALEMIKG